MLWALGNDIRCLINSSTLIGDSEKQQIFTTEKCLVFLPETWLKPSINKHSFDNFSVNQLINDCTNSFKLHIWKCIICWFPQNLDRVHHSSSVPAGFLLHHFFRLFYIFILFGGRDPKLDQALPSQSVTCRLRCYRRMACAGRGVLFIDQSYKSWSAESGWWDAVPCMWEKLGESECGTGAGCENPVCSYLHVTVPYEHQFT